MSSAWKNTDCSRSDSGLGASRPVEMAHGAHLLVYTIKADVEPATPLLRGAISYWRAGVASRRPYCPACHANYADGAQVGLFMLAVPSVEQTACSVTALCTACAEVSARGGSGRRARCSGDPRAPEADGTGGVDRLQDRVFSAAMPASVPIAGTGKN